MKKMNAMSNDAIASFFAEAELMKNIRPHVSSNLLLICKMHVIQFYGLTENPFCLVTGGKFNVLAN